MKIPHSESMCQASMGVVMAFAQNPKISREKKGAGVSWSQASSLQAAIEVLPNAPEPKTSDAAAIDGARATQQAVERLFSIRGY